MGLLAVLGLATTALAGLEINSKPVKTASNQDEETWVIRIDQTKTCGPGKIDAKPEPLHGHPLRMSSADLPGVIFGFDAAKKLSAIEITDPSRLELPGKLLLGKSRLEDFDVVLGNGSKPDPIPAGADEARQFQLAGSRLTLADTAAAPGIATTALLEMGTDPAGISR